MAAFSDERWIWERASCAGDTKFDLQPGLSGLVQPGRRGRSGRSEAWRMRRGGLVSFKWRRAAAMRLECDWCTRRCHPHPSPKAQFLGCCSPLRLAVGEKMVHPRGLLPFGSGNRNTTLALSCRLDCKGGRQTTAALCGLEKRVGGFGIGVMIVSS